MNASPGGKKATLIAVSALALSACTGQPVLTTPGDATPGRPAAAVFAPDKLPLVADECAKYSGARVYAAVIAPEMWNINVFKASSRSSVPICSFTYSGLDSPGGMADDASGNLWIMDSQTASLMAFAHGANGDSTPVRTISGTRTRLIGISTPGDQGIAVDASGSVWVPCWYEPNSKHGYVVAFANDANGNAVPVASIGFHDRGASESLFSPVGVGFDHQGNLYVAEYVPFVVAVFRPPFKDDEKPAAIWRINQNETFAQYVSVDTRDNVYISGQGTIEIFKNGLKSKGIAWQQIVIPQGAYDVKVDAKNRAFAALIGACDSRAGIAVLPPHASSFDPFRCITTANPPQTLALGS